MPEPRSFEDFWPDYLLAHSHPLTRIVHLAGTVVSIASFAAGLLLLNPWLPVAGLAVAYAVAWLSHALIEGNMPKTFSHPIWSLRADVAMLGLALRGRLKSEIDRIAGERRHTAAAPSRP